MKPPALPFVAPLGAAAIATAAQAHGWHGGADGGFAAGFAHPFTGIDHLLAMLAVGLWSASAGPRPWVAPLSFAALLILGALASGSGLVPAPLQQGTEPAIAVSVLVLGLLGLWMQSPLQMLGLLLGLQSGALMGHQVGPTQALSPWRPLASVAPMPQNNGLNPHDPHTTQMP